MLLCATLSMAQKEAYATYYHNRFHGSRTSSGEVYSKHAYTCAHRTYPFGTLLRVTNTRNNKSVIVKVNDRGPFHKKYSIDLSYAAAKAIGMISHGVAKVRIQVVSPDKYKVGIDDEADKIDMSKTFNEDDIDLGKLKVKEMGVEDISTVNMQFGKKKWVTLK